MSRKHSTRFGKALERVNQEKSWEERLVAFVAQVQAEFRAQPLNMTAMAIAIAMMVIAVVWGLGYIAPTFDPSR